MTGWVIEVEGMTCGGCASSVRRALEAAAPGAQVDVDLASRRARVVGEGAEPDALQEAIEDAGFGVTGVSEISPDGSGVPAR
jgi:copper chaperone